MMDNLEITAKTVEEATKKARAIFNLDLDKLEITVISEGRSGILGLGSADAKISVKARQSETPVPEDELGEAKQVVQELLDKVGVKATLNVYAPQEALDEDGEANPVVFNLTGDDMGAMIGRRGQTIDAFQYLVRLILTRKTHSRIPIMIDVENYKQRRFEDLKTMALNVADQVKSRKSSVRLEPMTAYERRIIHMTLANDPDVLTESTGEGESRKVVVFPKSRR
jgi:spoIIIJ-associated protein